MKCPFLKGLWALIGQKLAATVKVKIKSAVAAIEEAGLKVRMEEKEYEEYIEVLIQIPRKRR